MMENYIEKPFGLKRNLEYIRVNFWLMFKSLIEYKTNFYSGIITQIFYLGTYFFILRVISTHFGVIIGWNNVDFIIYLLVVDLIFVVAGIFSWLTPLFDLIKDGELNIYINKPIRTFFGIFFNKIDGAGFIMIIMNSICIIFLIFKKITLLSFIILTLMIIFFSIFSIVFFNFLQSFEFISLGLGDFLNKISYGLFSPLSNYPINFLKKFNLRNILLLSTHAYVALFLIEFLKKPSLEVFLRFEFIVFFILILIFSFGIWLNWHYGLKKYEAFG